LQKSPKSAASKITKRKENISKEITKPHYKELFERSNKEANPHTRAKR